MLSMKLKEEFIMRVKMKDRVILSMNVIKLQEQKAILNHISRVLKRVILEFIFSLTLFVLGGGANLTPPPVVFLHNSKSIGLRLLKFSDFSYIPKAIPLDLKPGFNTKCLSPQANCLNDCFFL